MRKTIIALPKSERLLPQAYHIFKSAGFISAEVENVLSAIHWKQLEFPVGNHALFLLVRPDDIPQYVDKNWAEMGIAGFDSYREYELANVTRQNSMRGDNFLSEVLPDLHLCAKARFCVSGKPEKLLFYDRCKSNNEIILTAATQHPHIAAKYFSGKGVTADIVTVSGSTELMPRHGEVDVIFDIVETGRALAENNLIIFEEAMPIQTKILVSKAALKYDENVKKMIGVLKDAIEQGTG